MKLKSEGWVVGTLAAVLAVGCVVGDGSHSVDDPPLPCRLYPEDAQECGKQWSGHIVQSCGEGDSVTTRLHFDRPDAPDTLRANLLDMGSVDLYALSLENPFIDTGVVCDRGLCRELVTEFRVYGAVPGGDRGSGVMSFWEPEKYGDSLGFEAADGGSIEIDSVWKESCSE